MLDGGLQHVATREYRLQCNWKVFADNYLVRLRSVAWPGALYEGVLVMSILDTQAISSPSGFGWLLPAVQSICAQSQPFTSLILLREMHDHTVNRRMRSLRYQGSFVPDNQSRPCDAPPSIKQGPVLLGWRVSCASGASRSGSRAGLGHVQQQALQELFCAELPGSRQP